MLSYRLLLVAICCWLSCGQDDIQETIEGIMGLMQRFEGLQLQLNTLPNDAVQKVSRDGQGLHRRFLLLQQATGTGNPDPNELVTFHSDLAEFVGRVEGLLGVHGPQGGLPGSLAQSRQQQSSANMGRVGGMPGGQAGAITPATDTRLQAAMSRVMQGMQRFEALQRQLSNLAPQRVNGIVTRANTLDMEFRALQNRGSELAGDGSSPLRESDALPFTELLESLSISLEALVRDTEEALRQPVMGQAGRGFGLPAMNPNAAFHSASQPIGIQDRSVPGGGPVTPATDERLSAVINKVMVQMQAFEAMKPKIQGLAASVFMRLAKQAEAHDSRFRTLQRRGEGLVGDGSKPMAEVEALAYAEDLEEFRQDQEAFMRDTQREIDAAGQDTAAGGPRQFPKLQPSSRPTLSVPRADLSGLSAEKLPPLRLKPPPGGHPVAGSCHREDHAEFQASCTRPRLDSSEREMSKGMRGFEWVSHPTKATAYELNLLGCHMETGCLGQLQGAPRTASPPNLEQGAASPRSSIPSGVRPQRPAAASANFKTVAPRDGAVHPESTVRKLPEELAELSLALEGMVQAKCNTSLLSKTRSELLTSEADSLIHETVKAQTIAKLEPDDALGKGTMDVDTGKGSEEEVRTDAVPDEIVASKGPSGDRNIVDEEAERGNAGPPSEDASGEWANASRTSTDNASEPEWSCENDATSDGKHVGDEVNPNKGVQEQGLDPEQNDEEDDSKSMMLDKIAKHGNASEQTQAKEHDA